MDQPEIKPPFRALRNWLTVDLIDELIWRIEHGEIGYTLPVLQILLLKANEQKILEDNFMLG